MINSIPISAFSKLGTLDRNFILQKLFHWKRNNLPHLRIKGFSSSHPFVLLDLTMGSM